MIFWYTKLAMGWMVCREQGIEKTVELTFAYVTDVTNFHGAIKLPWAWFPQSMSMCRILYRKLFAEDVVVGHTVCGYKDYEEPRTLGVRRIMLEGTHNYNSTLGCNRVRESYHDGVPTQVQYVSSVKGRIIRYCQHVIFRVLTSAFHLYQLLCETT